MVISRLGSLLDSRDAASSLVVTRRDAVVPERLLWYKKSVMRGAAAGSRPNV